MRNTSLCYIERGGKYLMLHRVKKTVDENKDKWIGIGGKFEEGESPEDCVMREVSEETGLTLNSWQYRGIVTFVSDEWGTEYMHLFTSDDFSGTPRECDEGVLEWIEKERPCRYGRATRYSFACWTRTSRFSPSSSAIRATDSFRPC